MMFFRLETCKYESFGWDVLEMNSNDFEEVLAVLAQAKSA